MMENMFEKGEAVKPRSKKGMLQDFKKSKQKELNEVVTKKHCVL